MRAFLSEVRMPGAILLSDSRQKKNQPRAVRTPNQHLMNSSTKDKIEGTAKEAMGKVKEETGKAIGNPNLRDRGTAEKVAGKVERKVGDVKKVFGK
jgi:uncharacterized protein YjbJ (UPF0337 family)